MSAPLVVRLSLTHRARRREPGERIVRRHGLQPLAPVDCHVSRHDNTAPAASAHRTDVDADLGPQLKDLGDRDVAVRARAAGYRLDPHSLMRRTNRAESDRHVSVRPAPETMTCFTGLLPVADGVAGYACLKKQAESLRAEGDIEGYVRAA